MPNGPRASIEYWIAKRLGQPDLIAGVTTADDRRERIRRAILDSQHEEAIAGKRKDAACETWGELFARLYGEPLRKAA